MKYSQATINAVERGLEAHGSIWHTAEELASMALAALESTYEQKALRAPTANCQPRDETGWVIEQYIASTLHYWTGCPRKYWSTDNARALRFARRCDAECMQSWHAESAGRVVEHMWVFPDTDSGT